MRCSELTKQLEKAKCYVVRHGKRHDIWCSPITGKKIAVPRHGSQELPNGTAKNILKVMLGK